MFAIFFLYQKLGGEHKITFDASVLGVLVTILIGWNIWSAIDINKKVEETKCKIDEIKVSVEKDLLDIQRRTNKAIDNCNKNIDSNEEYNMACTDFVQGLIYYNDTSDSRYMMKYKIFTSALMHYLRSDNQIHQQIDACLINMENCLTLQEKSLVSKRTRIDNIGLDNAVEEILTSPSKEFNAEQRKRFALIEERRIQIQNTK